MTNFNTAVDKQSPQYQENLLKAARYNLLVVIIFTVLNLVMLLVGSNRYFLFSATIPYYLTYFGYLFDHFMVGTYTLTGLTMGVVFVATYGACWFLCKKDSRWYIVALVLFAVDSLAMALLLVLTGSVGSSIFEIVLHVWVLISLGRAIAAARKLKDMPADPQPPQYTFYTETEQDQETV